MDMLPAHNAEPRTAPRTWAHAWKADGDESTVLVWVNTPKSF